jgi:serralysin
VDADTITGGAGNNVIFGELGDNTITGGSGNDNIDGGNGFSTLDGGGGMNFIVDDRSRDTYVFGGGNDIPASSLNTTAGSPLLAVTWQSVIGTELGSGIFTSGRPAVEFISLDGTTTLAELGGHYFIYSGLGNWSGTMLELNGVPVTTGGVWVPIGAVQVGNTYEVAWQLSGTSEFTVWTTNAAGNYVSDIGVVSGTSAALESAELTFDQDLNRDGVIGPKSTLVQSNTVGSVTTTRQPPSSPRPERWLLTMRPPSAARSSASPAPAASRAPMSSTSRTSSSPRRWCRSPTAPARAVRCK